MGDDAQASDPIQRVMGKTGIGLDLLQAMRERAAQAPAPQAPAPPAEAPAPSLAPADRPAPQAPAPPPGMFAVVMEMNTAFPRGAAMARAILLKQFLRERAGTRVADAKLARAVVARMRPPALPAETTPLFHPDDELAIANSLFTDHYLFGAVAAETIDKLAGLSIAGAGKAKPMVSAPLYKVWRDHPIAPLVFTSTRTIKCDAARVAFAATGKDIVWAVADTGVDDAHPHFHTHGTLRLKELGLRHRDFTGLHATEAQAEKAALIDEAGHGTHIAGIIAGETRPTARRKIKIAASVHTNDTDSNVATVETPHDQRILGLAPKCKIMSLRVLSSGETGRVSYLLAAIGYLQEVNEFGRNIKVHGLNISLGYPFLPQWFAAGQSPLCVEVDRLVRSGVAVVVAAGNAGYGQVLTSDNRSEFAAHEGTIADPGNADLALTVGSTHREMPHVYGVSYFSAKGPTADGRMKPDLVAPGERIVSCAPMASTAGDSAVIPFREMSGTSMAAPHVSGSIAAFLSVRAEFRGRAEAVKTLFCANAVDLKRKAEFQGAGLVDVLRTLQAV